jgi:hypothetical protein
MVPEDGIAACVNHFLSCKSKSPGDTFAVVVLPQRAGPWSRVIKHSRVIAQYGSGYHLFQDCHSTPLRVTRNILVNSLDCCEHVLASIPGSTGLTFQRVGKVAGESANILFDSGAYYNFTSEAVVKARGWKMVPHAGTAQLTIGLCLSWVLCRCLL